jgi:hypothetical protein
MILLWSHPENVAVSNCIIAGGTDVHPVEAQ